MNQVSTVKNEKPRIKAATSTQGIASFNRNGKSSISPDAKARYEKGLELYRAGGVSIGQDGYFKVLGFTVDTEKVSCDCPEQKPCLHYYAACIFQKAGKPESEQIHHRNGHGKPERQKVAYRGTESHKKPQDTPNKHIEAPGKDFNFPRVRVRLSALSLAVTILETHGKPITSKNLFKVASELETWALGN